MEVDTITRALLGAVSGNSTATCSAGEIAYCYPYVNHGTSFEKSFSLGCQWLAFVVSILILAFYAWRSWKYTCGWEEVYVCIVEFIKVNLEIWHEFSHPATLYLTAGNHILWLRYAEWLLTCPVILIHLSNITGLKDDYSPRTMRLLVSDIGTIVWGVTAALTTGPLKALFFIIGLIYGANTFFTAAKIYIESYHSVPQGHCQIVVKYMAWTFFTSWVMFPILFVAGPEGLGLLSPYGSTIGHTVADLLSKNLWGLMGHHLRVKIHEHILEHGDIRKKTTITIAGVETEVEQFVDDVEEEGAIKHSTADLAARRGSFVVMRDRMRERGKTVRASLDRHDDDAEASVMINTGPGQFKAGYQPSVMAVSPASFAPSEPARIILGLLDEAQVPFFRNALAALPMAVELVPAIGADNILQITQQAIAIGGCDFILLQPEFLQDRSPASLVQRLRMAGQRVCAFGWGAASPARELIESSGLDGWLEGPSWGTGINAQQLLGLVVQMQAKRKMAALSTNTLGGGWLSAGVVPGSQPAAGQGSRPVSPLLSAANPLFGTSPSPLSMSTSSAAGLGLAPTGSINSAMHSALYGSQQQPQQQPALAPAQLGAVSPPSQRSSLAPAASGEAEMLQALMGEINRLKSELGES